MTLIGAPASPFVRRARVALAEAGIAYTLLDANAWDASPAVAALLPAGKIPGLVAEGHVFFDSRVIVDDAAGTRAAPTCCRRAGWNGWRSARARPWRTACWRRRC